MELYLSKSLIDTFITCNLKFNWRYVDKQKVVQDSENMKPAIFGNLIHKVMETYFGASEDKKPNIMELYREEFKKAEITSREFFDLGEKLITDYIRDCDSGIKILGLEKDFMFFLDNGIPVKGIIDRVNEISEEEVEIEDYKSGFSQPLSQSELENDLQLGMYDLAIRQMYPKYKKVKVTLNYLHYGKISCYHSADQLDALKNYLAIIYSKITSMVEQKKEFLPRVNSYCSFCDYKSQCSAFKAIVEPNSSKDIDNIANEYKGLILQDKGVVVPLEKVDEFLVAVKGRIKILKKLEDEVKEFLVRYVKENGNSKDGRVKVGKSWFGLGSRKSVEYNVYDVLKTVNDKDIDLNSVLKSRKTEIDKIFSKDPEVLALLKSNAREEYGESYLK